MTPLRNELFIRPLPYQSTGAIIIPEMASPYLMGEVVEIGGQVKTVRRGDVVAYRKQNYAEMEGMLCMREGQLIGKAPPEQG